MPLNVFCLTGSDGSPLHPAVQATVLAKYSRSALSAREIIETLTEEESSKFQEKWFVSYGHSSVGELASIAICFENVSIIASKFIESFQRAAYSEKSTRYQVFTRDSFVLPPRAPASMQGFASGLYKTYEEITPKLHRILAQKLGKNPDDESVQKDRLIKARVFDNVRYLLPAGTGTNVGMVANARDVRYFVSQALSHTNREIREIGRAALAAVEKICPVFVKDAASNPFESTWQLRSLGTISSPKFDAANPTWYVDLYRNHIQAPPGTIVTTFQATVADLHGMSWETFCGFMNTRVKRAVPQIFRTVKIRFEIMMDFGAYRDLQRHRRCEIFPEYLTTNYGYLVPDDISGTELEAEYRVAMEKKFASSDLEFHDWDAIQYPIPLGYLHRSVFEMDLAELYYIAELRTQPQGHISYRRVAYEMYKVASELYPELMQWCQAIRPDEIGEHK